jgi:polygalacturonase
VSKEISLRRHFVKCLAAGAVATPVGALALDSLCATGREQISAAGGSHPAAEYVFNVTAFGAIGDGHTLCTAAIQKAVDACAGNGGKVVVPPGKYVTGPIFLRSNMELAVLPGATLLGSPVIDDYPSLQGRWEGIDRTIYASLLTGEDLENVTITGRGVLDGQGPIWWEANRKTNALRKQLGLSGREPDNPPGAPLKWPRPRIINLYRCKNVRISGLTVLNSPSWTIHPVVCEDVCIDQLTILTPDRAPNTDGIDPDSCKNVRISNCYIATGDDAIIIKSGYKYKQGNPNIPSEDIVISNCVFGHGWGGVGIGSETAGGVRNVTVSNCVCDGARRGLYFKTARSRGNVVENVRVTNFVMRNLVDAAIHMSMFYSGGDPSRTAVPVSETTPTFRNFHFSNISVSGAKSAAVIEGLPENPIQNLSFSNVIVESVTNGMSCSNVRGLTLDNLIVNSENAPAVALADVRDLEVLRFSTKTPKAQEPNLRFERVENAIVQSCRAFEGSGALLEVKGGGSGAISLALNRVAKSVKEVAFTEGAAETAIERRG